MEWNGILDFWLCEMLEVEIPLRRVYLFVCGEGQMDGWMEFGLLLLLALTIVNVFFSFFFFFFFFSHSLTKDRYTTTEEGFIL